MENRNILDIKKDFEKLVASPDKVGALLDLCVEATNEVQPYKENTAIISEMKTYRDLAQTLHGDYNEKTFTEVKDVFIKGLKTANR